MVKPNKKNFKSNERGLNHDKTHFINEYHLYLANNVVFFSQNFLSVIHFLSNILLKSLLLIPEVFGLFLDSFSVSEELSFLLNVDEEFADFV
jgi:hypothetical protein